MRETLLALPKATILDLFKHLNGGAVGFDHERTKKTECVDRLLSQYNADAIQAAITAIGAKAETPTESVPAPSPAAIPPETPVESVPAPAAPVVKTTAPKSDDVVALLRNALGVQVDPESVRSIVLDEVKKALDKSPVVKIEVRRPDGTDWKPSGHVRPEFQDILLDAQCGLNILLVGPAGSGKTHLAHQVAEALGKSFASVSCTAGMSESVLSGWLLPQDGGAFDYVESDFVRLYENGGVFLFDEVDAADPNTLLFINQALANGSFYLPQRKGRSLVKRHADFVCIAAANTFGNGANGTYSGRERLDEAFLDRFRAGRHFVDYDTKFERQSVDPSLLAWGWAVRKKINDLRMQRVMSTRFLLDATKLIKAGATFERVKNKFFLDWKAEDRTKVDVG
jgi:cobaltochelatase CobS